jgi:glucose-6-phosphate isomerase
VAENQRLWLAGLRRAWNTSGALRRWIDEQGVTGVVWTPASYEIDDLAEPAIRLVDAGAKPDWSLFWDLAVEDFRAAADTLRPTLQATDWKDGFVAVWLDAGRLTDAQRAFDAAGDLALEASARPNVAAAFAWTSARASFVERLVEAGMPLALSGVRDQATADVVESSRQRAMERRRAELTKEDENADVPEVPVFLLGFEGGTYGVKLTDEFHLLSDEPSGGRLPLSPDAETAGQKAAAERLAARVREPARGDRYSPASFARGVEIECNELHSDEVLEDMWAHDHELWKEDPTEITNRLGWLDIAERLSGELGDFQDFARKARADVQRIVLCGMGGSSLAPETFFDVLGGQIPLTVLDTTHPDHIASVRASLDLDHTLFVIASKSGTTVETRSHMEYFWSLVPRGDRFIAITDPGTPLAQTAKERGFARVFENDPNIGGRYSALSYFGLVPAALCGVDVEALVNGARRAMVANGPGVAAIAAPGGRLGAAVGELATREGRDKLTLLLPDKLASFGAWIEQLIAESTGKQEKGVLPVTGEAVGAPDVYGSDRIFVSYTIGEEAEAPQLEALEAEFPVVRIRLPDVKRLGAEMFRWEVGTAIIGYELDINPFDQPDVEAAKQRARDVLGGAAGTRPEPGDVKAMLEGIEAPRYIAIQAYLPPTDDNARRLQAVRTKLRDRYKVAVTLGFGPRFLHSTGQFHKGGPNTGAFIQVTDEPIADIEIPTMGFTFGRLIAAQADGDLATLRDKGRAAARVSLAALEEI